MIVKAELFMAAMLMAGMAGMAGVAGMAGRVGAGTLPMCEASYKAGKANIRAEYRTEQAACNAMRADAQGACIETAKARAKAARAELKYGYCGKPAEPGKALQARR